MWVGFGLITLLAAFAVSLWIRLGAQWGGELRTLDSGRQYRFGVTKHKGSVKRVRIGVTVPKGYEFTLRREHAGDAWFKRIGLSAEIQVGDQRFDDALYFASDDADLGQLLGSQGELRAALLQAFDAGGSSGLETQRIRCAHGLLWAELTPSGTPQPEGAAAIVVPQLHAAAEFLRHHPRAPQKRRDGFVVRAALLLSVSTATAIYGAVGIFRTLASHTVLEPWQLFLFTLVPSLVALGLFLAAIVAVLGRSSRTHLVLLEGLVVGGFGFVMTGHALARDANTAFDTAEARRIERQDIRIEHRTSRGRKGRTKHYYYLYVDDWRTPDPDHMTLRIDSGTFHRLKDGGSAALFVRPGALGFEWIERIEHVATTPPR